MTRLKAVQGWLATYPKGDRATIWAASPSQLNRAPAVAIDAADTPCDAIDRLADLVAKSLVVADVSGAEPRFRLLDTTRAYAIEKLDESGERDRIARRHAQHHRNVFALAEGEAIARPLVNGWRITPEGTRRPMPTRTLVLDHKTDPDLWRPIPASA